MLPSLTQHNSAHWTIAVCAMAIAVGLVCMVSVVAFDRTLAEMIRANSPPGFIDSAQNFVALTIPLVALTVLVPVHQYALSEFRNRCYANQTLLLVLSVVLAALCVGALMVAFGRTGLEDYLTSGSYEFHYFEGTIGVSSFPSGYGVMMGAIAATYWLFAPSFRPTIALLSAIAIVAELAAAILLLRALFDMLGVRLGTPDKPIVSGAFGDSGDER